VAIGLVFKLLALLLALNLPAHAEPRVIAALGDSLTQGFGLQQADGFVPQMQLSPDVGALIVTLGGNDFMRGIDPANSRENLSGILAASAKRGMPILLVGMPSPRNFGPEYKAAVDKMYPELAAEFGVVYAPNFFAPIMDADTHLPDPAFMQADRIHPNPAGVLRIVQALGPKVLELLRR